MKPIFFITGTDTGVGKTVLTTLLARFLRGRKIAVAALKPVCSGGRDDACQLSAALAGALTLDEINPWHFRAPVTPALAARLEKKSVTLPQALTHIRAMHKRFDVLLVEGAGGLLSPLGENFNSRDLITTLHAKPIIVAQNRLGAVNHILLSLAALPKDARAKVKIVLMSPSKSDAATATNLRLLGEFVPVKKNFTLPWLGKNFDTVLALKNPQVRKALQALVGI